MKTLAIWVGIGAVAFVVLRRIGIAALFGKHPTASGDGASGGGGSAPSIFSGGGVTAPGVTNTPTGPTQASVNGAGFPVTVGNGAGFPGTVGNGARKPAAVGRRNGFPGEPVTVGVVSLFPIGSTGSYGVAGSTSKDLKVGLYPSSNRLSPSDRTSIVAVNIPGLAGKTQGVTPAQLDTFSAFHAHDAVVVAQQAIESNNVSAAQRGKGKFIGYRSDGTPFLVY